MAELGAHIKTCSLVLLMRTEPAHCRIKVGKSSAWSCATGELGQGLVTVPCCSVSGSA